MKRIINSLLDTDLYTFSMCLVYLMKFARVKGEYAFIDRDKTVYPKGFSDKVQEQVNAMSTIAMSDEEGDFIGRKCKYFPKWFILMLKAYRFDPSEVTITQDEDGHLNVGIKGYLWRTLFWEVPLLAIISELKHEANGDMINYHEEVEYVKSFNKGTKLVENGLFYSEFGTRRRFSYKHQSMVIESLVEAEKYARESGTCSGKLTGTSNVHFAMIYDLTPIGTMSHQFISMIGALFGYREANFLAMKYWQEVYDGDLGIYLYDTFGWESFESNFGLLHAKSFDGLRVDSGDNIVQLTLIVDKYKSLGVNPKNKTVTYSNGLNVDEAIQLHISVNGIVADRYGIGTNLTCDITDVKASNMVIKLIKAQITEEREMRHCIKLSNDIGKACGDEKEIELVKQLIIV